MFLANCFILLVCLPVRLKYFLVFVFLYQKFTFYYIQNIFHICLNANLLYYTFTVVCILTSYTELPFQRLIFRYGKNISYSCIVWPHPHLFLLRFVLLWTGRNISQVHHLYSLPFFIKCFLPSNKNAWHRLVWILVYKMPDLAVCSALIFLHTYTHLVCHRLFGFNQSLLDTDCNQSRDIWSQYRQLSTCSELTHLAGTVWSYVSLVRGWCLYTGRWGVILIGFLPFPVRPQVKPVVLVLPDLGFFSSHHPILYMAAHFSILSSAALHVLLAALFSHDSLIQAPESAQQCGPVAGGSFKP